jgi:N-acetyl-alpha-D-glucosaminyl L-malate synthase BshA
MHRAQGIPYPLFHSTPHDLAITSAILNLHREIGLDILHAHYALPHAVSAFLARSAAASDRGRPAPKVVTTLHGTDITLVGNDPSYAPLTEFVIRASDSVTAVSNWLVRETHRQFRLDVERPCSVTMIPNFVDTERFHPDAGKPLKKGSPPRAVHVSNFRPVKRVPWLLEAFARAVGDRKAELVLVGDGPDQAACREAVVRLRLGERVTFLGERDAIPEVLSPADVFVLTSREESFGLSALEAMSCGTPVMATDVGGVSEVVDDGETGMLAAVDDLDGFAAKLRALLFGEVDAKKMGKRARDVAVERFAREKIVTLYEDCYRCALGR